MASLSHQNHHTPNPFGSLAITPGEGCHVSHRVPKSFRHDHVNHHVTHAGTGTHADDHEQTHDDHTPAGETVNEEANKGNQLHAHGCKFMAKDIVIEALEDEKGRKQRLFEEEQLQKEREEEERRELARRGKVKGRYKNALMATRMNRILKEKTAEKSAKLAADLAANNAKSILNADGTSRLPIPFEDPLLRLQRKMANENKDHFILLHQRLIDLWFYRILCDVTLKTCDQVFHVHSCLLATHCCLWTDLCDEQTHEVCRTMPTEIDFRKKVTGIGLNAIIHYLYTGKIKIGHANCVEVFDAARALKMRHITQLTERFIKVLLQDHNLWSTVSATRGTHSAIFDLAWTKLATRFVRLSKTEAFFRVELSDLMWFLQSHELLITSELQVCQAAIGWIKYNRQDRIYNFATVMSAVRFAYMTTDELVHAMNMDPIFQSDEGIDLLSSANLAKVFATEHHQWSGFDLQEPRRPELRQGLKKFLGPDARITLADEQRLKALDTQVSTNTLDLGKLFDKSLWVRHSHSHKHQQSVGN